jgi:hypothetical protein
VTITSPANNLLTSDTTLVVKGTVSDLSIGKATLKVNGSAREIKVLDGTFS